VKWRVQQLAVLTAMTLTAVAAASSPQHTPARCEAHRLSMACVYAIVAYGEDEGALPHVLDEALDEVDRIDRLMSHYRPQSLLSRLNRDAAHGPVVVDQELFDFLTVAMHFSRESEGAFDVTVGPLMKAWGFFNGDGRVPDNRELAAIRGRIGYQHVILDPAARSVQFDTPGVELDLGGIAKGYAVDRVVALLKHHGVTAALVSAGGSTVYALGRPPDLEGWDVNVQDPLNATKIAFTTRLRDRALSVAGRSEKSFEVGGVQYSHIMDPRSRRPVQGVLSVAVVTDTGTNGDALDDALFVLGVEKSRTYLTKYPGTDASFMVPDRSRGWRLVPLNH
jgi:thiamine biosynthesis lipoprotein